MFVIRLAIAGDSGVGKTSLLVRFNEDTFNNTQKTTIGYDFKAKEVVIPSSSGAGSDHVKLQIWDTAGQERFRSMAASYYAKARGVVLTFDVCQRDSFNSLSSWIQDVTRAAPSGCVIVLCANKVDQAEESWKVRREDFNALAAQHGFAVFEASGKSGENVQHMFLELARLILAAHRQDIEVVDGGDPATAAAAAALGPTKNIVLLEDASAVEEKRKTRRRSSWEWC